ncbi:MAG: nitroreductase family deazaflavin-dependent oxidoreductase [Acidimicrobiales bacterium]
MTLEGEYEPSTAQWVRDQVEAYEASGGTEANTLRDTGLPIIIVTSRGQRSGKLRKTPLMRVAHDGEYALVASKGGAPEHPVWYYNLVADPSAVMIQDGPEPFDAEVREVSGDERAEWWERAVAAYPPYADYQAKTERHIPVLIARPASPTGR